jgi:hypothetical protein
MNEEETIAAIGQCATIAELYTFQVEGRSQVVEDAINARGAELNEEGDKVTNPAGAAPDTISDTVEHDAAKVEVAEGNKEFVIPSNTVTPAQRDLTVLMEAQEIRQDRDRFNTARSLTSAHIIG